MAKLTKKRKKDDGLFNRTTLAMCVMAATASTQVIAQEAEEVIVYGVKQSLETAQDIKREAATVQDVITASDIGSLPDKSIVEALQRVPGVAIERFEASDDPDHFTVEGGSVVIRGLNRVRSEFNGRDAFSADSSGGLNFDDIAPEMVGSVIVNKSQTADLVEGGISGTVNLVTRKPFDKDDLVLGFTAKANYSEALDSTTPGLSGIASNVWDLSDGSKFGALIAFSGSTIESRGDGIGVFNFYSYNSPNPDIGEALVTVGPSLRQQENERDRLGISGSLQWENAAETVTATLELIHSSSSLAWTEHFLEFPEQPFTANAADVFATNGERVLTQNDLTFETGACEADNTCQFTSGTLIGSTAQWNEQVVDIPYVSGARFREDEREINDLSFNVKFAVDDNLTITTDLQYVEAETDIIDNTAHGRFITDTFVDLRDREDPIVDFLSARTEVPDGQLDNLALTNPANRANYFWRSAMDHISDNEGEMFATSVDGEYVFDEGYITKVKAGVRYSNREQTIKESTFNWGNVSEVWAGTRGGAVGFDRVPDELVEQFTFEDHLTGGSLSSNDTFWFPRTSILRDGDELFNALTSARDADGNPIFNPAWTSLANRPAFVSPDRDASRNLDSPFLDSEIYDTEEERQALYVRLDFGDLDNDLPMEGNFGLRWVTYQLTSSGADNLPTLDDIDDPLRAIGRSDNAPPLDPVIPDDILDFHVSALNPAGDRITVQGEEFNEVLPSLNLKFSVTEDFIVRFAASQAMFMPNLRDVRRSRDIDSTASDTGTVTVGVDGMPLANPVPAGAVHDGFTANNAGNPLLQPELSTNIDLALEWYYDDLGSLTGTIFHKDIKDFHRNVTSVEQVTNPNNNITQPVAVTSTRNAGNAKIDGFELSGQTTFGFIDDVGENFGIQANYTYIDGNPDDFEGVSSGVGEFTFRNFGNLPLEGLSQDNYNIVLFYDDATFEGRFAYSWRSSYLLNSRDVIAFSPVFADATGQLDFSASWRINDEFKVGFQANNLLDEITRTRIQFNQEGITTPRSFFSNGIAASLFVSGTF